MAEFNIKPEAQLPNSYVGLSEGIRADRPQGVGILFEGLANSLDAGVKEQDRNIQRNIEEDIFAEVDSAQAEFGVPEATDMEADPEKESFAASPAGITRAKDQLDRLQAAYAQGTLKESHYWARLNSAVRQLRGKYPGYRAEIDQMVASVTGARPANALRNALMDEWEKAANKQSSLSKLEDWAVKNGRLPVDYYQRAQSGNPYSETELSAHIANKTRSDAEITDRRAALALQTDMGTANQKDAERAFKVESSQFVTTILKDASTTAGANYQQLTQKIREAQDAATKGNPLNDAEVGQLRTMMGQLKQSIRDELHKQYTTSWDGDPKHSYMALLDKKQRDDIVAEAMEPVSVLEDALSSENPWGVLGSVSAWLKAQETDANREVLRDYPFMREFKAMSDALGAAPFSQFLSLSPSLQKDIDQTMLGWHKIMMAKASQTGMTVSDSYADLAKKDADPAVYNGLIQQWTAMADQVTKGEMPIALIQSSVDFMFGPGSDKVLQQLNDASRYEYFRKVASPAVSQQMMKLRDKGDVDSWNKYQSWVARSFQVLFRDRVLDIQNMIDPGSVDVSFDQKTGRFKVKVTSVSGPADSSYMSQQMETYFNDLNSAIAVVNPILQANDGNTGMEILSVLKQMGFDPNVQKNPNFIQKMVMAVAKAAYDVAPSMNTGGKAGEAFGSKKGDTKGYAGKGGQVSKEQIMKFLFGAGAEGKSLYDQLQMSPVVTQYGQ